MIDVADVHRTLLTWGIFRLPLSPTETTTPRGSSAGPTRPTRSRSSPTAGASPDGHPPDPSTLTPDTSPPSTPLIGPGGRGVRPGRMDELSALPPRPYAAPESAFFFFPPGNAGRRPQALTGRAFV